MSRNEIIIFRALLLFGLVMFFFPLATLKLPLAGDVDISGYDCYSKMSRLSQNWMVQGGEKEPSVAESDAVPIPALPISIRYAIFVPVEMCLAFLATALALLGTLRRIEAVRLFSAIGCGLGLLAVLHISVMNSALHSWMSGNVDQSMKDNPFAGLADVISNAVQFKPGAGLIILTVALAIVAILSRARLLLPQSTEVDSNAYSEKHLP